MATALKVQITTPLIAQLVNSGLSPELLKSKFTEWKTGEPAEHYWFSREVKGDFGLVHVHMVPKNELEKLEKWNIAWGRSGYSKRVQ